MCVKIDNNHFYSDHKPIVNEEIKLMDFGHFQLEEGYSISSREIAQLPGCYRNDINEIFFRVINKSEVKNKILGQNASTVFLKVEDGKLFYGLCGTKDFFEIKDTKVQTLFRKTSRNIKKYLCNTSFFKERKVAISKEDDKILKTAPSDVEKVKKAIFKKMEKSDSEWSLWVIWALEIESLYKKFCHTFGIKVPDIIPPFINDILSYTFGVYGVINGVEINRDAKKIHDAEGASDGKHKVIRTVLAIFASLIELITTNFKIIKNALTKLCLKIGANFLFVFVTLYASLKYTLAYLTVSKFRRKFVAYLENDNLTHAQKVEGALRYLKNKVTVSEEDALKILKKVRLENPDLAEDKIQQLAHDMIAKKLLTKVKRFERRVDSFEISMIQNNIDEILKDLSKPENMRMAEKIIEKVKYKNDLNLKESKWNGIATILTASEIILFIVLAVPVYAYAFGALSSFIGSALMGMYFYRKHISKVDDEDDKKNLHEKLKLLADPII
ncbi:MAG: hypothetical protein WCT85_01860 [Parachlamydiales bacterium]|jgi:hypothetical protein